MMKNNLSALVASMALLAVCAIGVGCTPATAEDPSQPQIAVPTNDFLNSIGVVSTFPNRGQPLHRTVEMVRYGGFRWVRAGIEGLSEDGPTTIQTFIDLHRQTGVLLNWGLVSGGSDLDKLIRTGRILHREGALLAFEGNNEPNNWGVTYQGERGGGNGSWIAVAKLQRDLYQAVKSDPELSQYPVWSISAPGAQIDNVGLQFLEIPPGAGTLMPEGTKYADYANVHNYFYHPNSPNPEYDKVWNAADPSRASRIDGLYANFGVTWRGKYRGYSDEQLETLPRVTTETGVKITDVITEEMHGRYLANLYLAQFKRGYAYTSVYILRDRTDEWGNQALGFFRPDYTPHKAAIYLHNLTTILADERSIEHPGRLVYAIPDQPVTVHDLLLQNSNGKFQLVVWSELVTGTNEVTVELGSVHSEIVIYDPIVGVEPIRTVKDASSVELSLTDHPVVLEIGN